MDVVCIYVLSFPTENLGKLKHTESTFDDEIKQKIKTEEKKNQETSYSKTQCKLYNSYYWKGNNCISYFSGRIVYWVVEALSSFNMSLL